MFFLKVIYDDYSNYLPFETDCLAHDLPHFGDESIALFDSQAKYMRSIKILLKSKLTVISPERSTL